VVQIGTPVELFERPQHTFVGHFIGSPGMNILPAAEDAGRIVFEGQTVALEGAVIGSGGVTQIGVRPEFVTLAEAGVPARVRKVSDVGRHAVVETMVGDTAVKAVVDHADVEQGAEVHLAFRQDQTRLYRDGWIATLARGAENTTQAHGAEDSVQARGSDSASEAAS
ncbi:MAG: TOBE domain-containing protein, partial [Pseudomonadota bacterium]